MSGSISIVSGATLHPQQLYPGTRQYVVQTKSEITVPLSNVRLTQPPHGDECILLTEGTQLHDCALVEAQKNKATTVTNMPRQARDVLMLTKKKT
jgi:hypothetical protein